MSKGIFITFEGSDGCGKSTQIKKLAEYLSMQGKEVVVTREPGGTDISEQIRGIILDPNNKKESPVTEMMLYAAARAQIVSELIKPSIEAGKIVLCDRFVDSSIAYQAYGRGLGDQVKIVNSYALQGLLPDVTFFLDITAEEGRKRNKSTDKNDRMEQEAIEFHQRVYEGYKKIAEDNKDRVVVIDASKSIDEVFEEIKKVYDTKFNSK